MSYRCDFCHAMQYSEEHECPRAVTGGDQYAPGGLTTPRITRDQATAKSRAMSQAQAAIMIQQAPKVEFEPLVKPVTVTESEPPVVEPPSSTKSVSESLSEIDKLLAQGTDTSPKA